jgi:hypothetical protein
MKKLRESIQEIGRKSFKDFLSTSQRQFALRQSSLKSLKSKTGRNESSFSASAH